MLFPDPLADLDKIRSTSGRGVYASASPNYRDAIFGRDSLEVAEDLLAIRPELTREVLLTAAHFQGLRVNPITEEEPGRIHHEYRNIVMDGREVNQRSQAILSQLSTMWGGTNEEVLYYGSVDATPLYVRLVGRYCQLYGRELLDEPIIWRNGHAATMADSVREAVGWIERRVKRSDLSLIEFCRTNPYGHSYQVWKDGSTGFLHVDGNRANFSRPIAAIEVQGLAYDALMMASWLLADNASAEHWQGLAATIQQSVFTRFWMPRFEYFAQALDRNQEDGVRQVQTLTSNPAELLDTTIFDSLPVLERQMYVRSIINMVYSDDFLTDVGIRCRAVRHMDLIDFADYHGSWAVWAKATYDVAKGMRYQGFGLLAEQLEQRILQATRLSGWHYEFWYVDELGRVDYDPKRLRPRAGDCIEIVGTHVPEDTQAWTVSACLAISEDGFSLDSAPSTEWARSFENRLLIQQSRIAAVTTVPEAEAAYPEDFSFAVNLTEGYKRRRAYVERQFLAS